MPVKRVRTSVAAGSGEGGRRWLKRFRMGTWVGGIRRTRRPDEMVGQWVSRSFLEQKHPA